MRQHRRPFFFDQGGRLAARFGLRFTPVLVEQAGTQLRITEIPVEDRDDPGSEAGTGPGSESDLPRTPIRGTGPGSAGAGRAGIEPPEED